MHGLDNYELDGRPISIVFAKENRKTPDQMRPRYSEDSRHRERRDSPGRDDDARYVGLTSRYLI